MPCGCQNACGCTILGDSVTTTAVTVGDTTTVSAIQTFLGVLDTPCVNMSVALGIVSAALIFDPTTQSVIMSCGATGIIANLKIDPTSTAVIHSVSNAGLTSTLRIDPLGSAPVSQSAAGLKVDCCPAGPPAIADTSTIDLSVPAGILNAVVIPNTLAGIENQAGGVSIKLEDDPAPIVASPGNNVLRFTAAGDLTLQLEDLLAAGGIDAHFIPNGAVVALANPGTSAASITVVITNPTIVDFFVRMEGIAELTGVATGAPATAKRWGMTASLDVVAVTGTASSVGAAGLFSVSEFSQSGVVPADGTVRKDRASLAKWARIPPLSSATFLSNQSTFITATGWGGVGAAYQFLNIVISVLPARSSGWPL